jgi:prepilin-type N-terminal cleavage/methylation domain-containing protein
LKRSKQKVSGFTLVEIVIVVVIIGLLATMAYPVFIQVKNHSQASRIANDFRAFSGLFETYMLDNGVYPADASPGAIPTGMEDYIKSSNWSEPSPIGGNYDWFYNGVGSGGIVAAVSITSYTSGDDPISKLDEIMDDGNLGTGIIQKNGGAVIYIIE